MKYELLTPVILITNLLFVTGFREICGAAPDLI